MTKVSFSMKKVITALLIGAFYAPCICTTSLPTGQDAYVLEFARKYSDHVEYLHDGRDVSKLTLYANPRTVDIVLQIIGGLVVGGVGAGFLYYGINGVDGRHRNLDTINRAVFDIIGVGAVAFGVYAFFDALNDYSMKSKKIPYIILDPEGLLFWNGKRIWWSDVDHTEITSEQKTETTNYQVGNTGISTSHGTVITIRTLHLLDKYNSDLFKTSERDCYLPITFDQFRGLIEHYVALYGSHRTY
ncbi:MAG: hypothetical protein WC365_10280 [Candidatus Babeliales bacterium]|jgi:hypothetical protein